MITIAFADYNYYTETYKGNAIPDQDTFDRYALRASEEIEYQTLDKASATFDKDMYVDEIKSATCAVADVMYQQYTADHAGQTEGGGRIESENNDGFSVKYKYDDKANTESGYKAYKRGMTKAINKYLLSTNLLNRRAAAIC